MARFYCCLAVMVALLGVSCSRSSKDTAVAFVNQAPISQWELDLMVRSLAEKQSKDLGKLTPEEKAALQIRALKEMVLEKLLIDAAAGLKIPQFEELVERRYQIYVKEAGGEDPLLRKISRDYSSLKEFRKRVETVVRKEAIVAKWIENVPRGTADEIKSVYLANEEKFKEQKMEWEEAKRVVAIELFKQRYQAIILGNVVQLERQAKIVIRDPHLGEMYGKTPLVDVESMREL